MKFETIIVDTKESIATITLNRPEKLNTLIPQMAEELISAFGMVDKDIETKVVVLTATGRAFSTGADIGNWFLPLAKERRGGSIDDVTNHFLELVPLALSKIRKPVIAAINGLAVGFGCSLTLPCDIRIASEDARFSLPFARAGVSPEMGSSYFLSRLIGLGKACELILTAKIIDAKEAKGDRFSKPGCSCQ